MFINPRGTESRASNSLVPPLSRHTLIKLCEDGTFETAGGAPTLMGWLAFEDSFLAWLRKLDCVEEEKV
jgi:hypothetical protein